ncbi:hypothetical protein OHW83_17895 [Acinetobacter baumannii]|nr:hypothetical protein [Acinetobacter baumannii]
MNKYLISLFFIIPSVVYADINNGTLTMPINPNNSLAQRAGEAYLRSRESGNQYNNVNTRKENIRWESATNTGKSSTGDMNYTNCFYKTMGGYSFGIVVNSSFCPYSVEINPESGRVRF